MNVELSRGLLTRNGSIPLEGVRIEVSLVGTGAEVSVTQRYTNRESVPVEAVYVFPLEESAAVCGFSAKVGERLVVGKVMEREAAFERYDDAMMRGDGAFLLDQERPNVFTASVGNLRPKETVQVQLRYVSQVSREGNALRLMIPTTVSPRYVPSGPAEVGQSDGERVNPEHASQVPYGLSLTVAIDGTDLARIESPSHPIRTTFGDAGAKIELAREETALDRDFVLIVERRTPEQPKASVIRGDDGTRYAMVTFLPQFNTQEDMGHEVFFLLDCSGSMMGESIEQARRALSLSVRALGMADTFNIVRFGSSFESLFDSSRRFDEQTLERASEYIRGLDANLGGTEVLNPLRALVEAATDPKRPRRILLLTDGQVSNEDEVMALARKHAETTRIFSFGIGAGASEHLVRGTARASRGAAEMIHPGERIEPKVLRMFARVRMPVLDDARIDWKGLVVEQAPRDLPPVFAGEALTVLARIESGSASDISLLAGNERFTLPINLEAAQVSTTVPLLWAREAIRELDDTSTYRGSAQKRGGEERRTQRLVELGTKYGLLNQATSFVAVEERSRSERADAPAELRRIPVALTAGWGGVMRDAMGGGVLRGALGGGASTGAVPPPCMCAPAAAPSPAPMGGAPGGFVAKAISRVFGGAPSNAAPAAPSPSPARFEKRRATIQESSPSDPIFDLLMTQRAEGSFPSSKILLSLLGAARERQLTQAIEKHGEVEAVTATVVLLLEEEHLDRESEWRPAITKAKAWLAKHNSSFEPKDVVGSK
jgi:Ca-activated chloride channel homolog